jgi:hypothetical protein
MGKKIKNLTADRLAWLLCLSRAVCRGVGDCLVWCLRLAGLELADRDDLVLAAKQDGVGAIIGLLQGRDVVAPVLPDQNGLEKVLREFLWQLAAQIVLARQRKNRCI